MKRTCHYCYDEMEFENGHQFGAHLRNCSANPKRDIINKNANMKKIKRKEVICRQCSIVFSKRRDQIERTKNNFCSKSCAAKYNNTHKTKGNRRSKLEAWLETKLKELYPNETILFNDKSAINSELDIYFPNRKLAFELNGIFHFEPIYGEDKLQQIQENDQRKFKLCSDAGIALCLIDVSQQKHFKERTSIKYLNIIQKIIGAG